MVTGSEVESRSMTQQISDKVDILVNVTGSIVTQNQLAQLEARLISYEAHLQGAVSRLQSYQPTVQSIESSCSTGLNSNASSLEIGSITTSNTPTPSKHAQRQIRHMNRDQIMRLIDTAVLVRSRRGKTTYDLLAIEDTDFAHLSREQQQRVVHYLQCLRLLLWLFKEENQRTAVPWPLALRCQSGFAIEAAASSRMNFCGFMTSLDEALSDSSVQLGQVLPGMTHKAWVQYMFKRVEDHQDSKVITAVAKQWDRIPPPAQGHASYSLLLPRNMVSTGVITTTHFKLADGAGGFSNNRENVKELADSDGISTLACLPRDDSGGSETQSEDIEWDSYDGRCLLEWDDDSGCFVYELGKQSEPVSHSSHELHSSETTPLLHQDGLYSSNEAASRRLTSEFTSHLDWSWPEHRCEHHGSTRIQRLLELVSGKILTQCPGIIVLFRLVLAAVCLLSFLIFFCYSFAAELPHPGKQVLKSDLNK